MNKTDIMNNVTRTFHKVGFQLKKHSPEILLVTGVVGTVASAIMACKATTKVNIILEDTKHATEVIHEGVENGEIKGYLEDGTVGMVDYSEEDGKKDLAIVYAQTGMEFVKLYGPSVVLGMASIGCILASNNIIRKRNVALTAAYASVDSAFKEYRGRVIERFGKELDRELKYNIKAKEIEETVVNEDGTETTVTSTVQVAEIPEHSIYSRFFDETAKGWDKNANYNRMFLDQTERAANRKLKERGHLFLNEVYDMLGIQRTPEGQIVGWIYDPENPIGDNKVDFGIFDVRDEQKRLFVNGYERSILLDFNVDGNIWELLK